MKITKLRKSKSMTQSELADFCETTQQQIAKIEKGVVDPKVSTLRRIADAFGCEIKDLFWSKREFLNEINDTIKESNLKSSDFSLMGLNSLCAKERKIFSFHPYWEQIEVKNNKALYKEV